MQALQHHLADTLKRERSQRGWSLAQAADATGVSKAMLGQIERGESSPTIATLWKIATGFSLAFSAFIPAEQGLPQRSHPTPVAYQQSDRGMQATLLFPFDPATGFELLVIELAAGALSESSAHEAGIIEHVIVLEGELEIGLDGEWQRLACGEGIRFHADRPHAYRNPGALPVRFHDVIHYPKNE